METTKSLLPSNGVGSMSKKELGRAPGTFYNLRDEVARLAAPPAVAEAYLRQVGTWDCLDELALEFNGSFVALRRMKLLSERQEATLAKIDEALTSMSGPERAELWYGTEGLERPEWEEIRKLAAEALPLVSDPSLSEGAEVWPETDRDRA